MISLNQVITGLNRIVAAHKQLNTFYQGDPFEFATSGTTNYPAMVVDLIETKTLRSNQKFTFDFFLMDLVRKGESNETEVLSDLALIAKDISAELKHPNWTWYIDLNSEIVWEAFTEKDDDMVSGYKATIELMIDLPDDECAIPKSSINRF
jgi:hypothetical protein